MDIKEFDPGPQDIAWCPGCGNFSILAILKKALASLDIKPENLVVVSGIGQAAKAPHYFKTNFFNGLHGRALPPATAIKAANPNLVVIAESGDGDTYGEGGNHFIHTIRRNPGIVNVVHNNMVYGLTKGQASPTSRLEFKTPVQVDGVSEEPFNPLSVAIALDASFVARAYCADIDRTVDILTKALQHKAGYALVDIFQPCVSFNKVNTYQWFKDNTYYLEEGYDPHDRQKAFQRACETEKLPLGIFYINDKKKPFEQTLSAYETNKQPLYQRSIDRDLLQRVIDSKRA